MYHNYWHGPRCNGRTMRFNCKYCGMPIYWFSCDCGSSVLFEKLGDDWPKHECLYPAQPLGSIRARRSSDEAPFQPARHRRIEPEYVTDGVVPICVESILCPGARFTDRGRIIGAETLDIMNVARNYPLFARVLFKEMGVSTFQSLMIERKDRILYEAVYQAGKMECSPVGAVVQFALVAKEILPGKVIVLTHNIMVSGRISKER